MRKYYTEQTMESIARRVLDAYDERLYRGQPRAIPIEDLIERHGLTLEFQYLRKNGRILGKTVFDTGLEAVYDMELGEYTLFPVKAGTILIDASLCEEETSTGRLRFTEAHELSHWILHKGLYTGTGESAALQPAVRETSMEIQANMLGSALLMPMPMVKRCFYQMRSGHCSGHVGGVSGIPPGHADPAHQPPSAVKFFTVVFSKLRTLWKEERHATSEKNPCGALPCVR